MTKDDKIKSLELSVEELRRMHEEVCEAYNRARIKVITFLGGELTLLGFLYNGGDLFFPQERYGKIFYLIGLSFSLLGLGILFFALHPVQWRVPTKRKKHKKLQYKNYMAFLEYIRDEYVEGLNINLGHNEKKQTYLNLATSLILTGAILLVVIKNFNP